jgi:DNA-binding GntR family transcriptional regulator
VSDRHGFPALDDLWAARSNAAAGDAVHRTLREAIMSGRLRPGDHLAEEYLARQFGVSRTPVREAILRLETEQLAERVPRRGLVVRGIPEREVLEVYTVRTSLDALAARLAATQSLPADRAHLRWVNQRLAEAAGRGDDSAMAELNIQFHEAICEAAHNGMLLRFMRQIHDWVHRFGETTFSFPGRAQTAVAEHERVLEAIEEGDAAAAEQLARDHMISAQQARIAMLRRDAREAS